MPKGISGKQLLSDFVSYSKYAQWIPATGSRESWGGVVMRQAHMHMNKHPNISDEIMLATKHMVEKKVMGSMRAAQFGGEPMLRRPSRCFNCAYTPVTDVQTFGEIMYLLLGGSGVGFSVEWENTKRLPRIRGIDKDSTKQTYMVQDTTEGWADAAVHLIRSYMEHRPEPVFDYSQIRPPGSLLHSSGGRAPGHKGLKKSLDSIRKILDGCVGRKLRPIDVHDICCWIADCVHSGGIRRSACISFFDLDDTDMLACKAGDWWNYNPQRARSNNSAVMYLEETTKEEFDVFFHFVRENNTGEPGIYWVRNRSEMRANPCLTADTMIYTSKGHLPISELIGKPFTAIVNGAEAACDAGFFSTGVHKVFRLETVEGFSLRLTANHKLLHINDIGEEVWTAVEDLSVHDKIGISNHYEDGDGKVATTTACISSIVADGEEEVFDCNVNYLHEFCANGVRSHNCVEIGLNPRQFCNLSTMNGASVESHEDFIERCRVLAILGTVQASYTDFPYLRYEWQQQTEKEALLGCSISGIGAGRINPEWLDEGAKVIRHVNAQIAKKIGINPAARTTAIKPDGNSASLLGGPSGVHAWKSPYYMRTARVGKDEAVYHYLAERIPALIEDDMEDPVNRAVLRVPIAVPYDERNIFESEETAIDLLERIKVYNTHWISPGHRSGDNMNNVSSTVTVKDHEWDDVQEWLWENRHSYHGITTFPYWGGTHRQLPFCPITEDEYIQELKHLEGVHIDFRDIIESENNVNHGESIACAGGVCDIL